MTTSMMTSPDSSPSTEYSSLSPTSVPSQSSSSNSYRATKNHLGLPIPPPPDRLPPPKGRSVHIPGQKLKLLKGKDKARSEVEEEEWVLEDGNGRGSGRRDSEDAVIKPEISPLFDSQLTKIPQERQEKRSKARGLVKKTSRMFSRDKDRTEGSNGGTTPDSASSLHLPTNSRQQSYSSATSSETSSSRHTFAIARPISNTSNQSGSNHSRRLSQDSANSWQRPPRSTRSGSTSTREASFDQMPPIPHRQSSNMSASVPTLSRNALPQPGPSNSIPENGNFPSRMSTWFSHLLPSTSTNGSANPSTSPPQDPPSPARKSTSAAASFLNAARQRAVDGVRHLLDSEAQPDKCVDTMWVMGVAHPGWRPSTPSRSPSNLSSDLPEPALAGRRGSNNSDRPSPPPKDALGVRQAAWKRHKDPVVTASPPSKGFGLFSTSTLSLSLPAAIQGSPSKEEKNAIDSPGKNKKSRVEKEILKWPDQFYDDFRSRVWCTYRAQYAPILSLPPNLLIPSPEAYYSAFGPPLDASASQTGPSRPPQPSPSASWGWTGERGLTSDAGWGCMLRTGQSMLANALIHLHLGRAWRLPAQKPSLAPQMPSELAALQAYSTHVKLLSWFMDDPSSLCPFSVHRMALIGKELGKEVGEWFGPSTASGALKTLTNSFPICGLAVATATDSMVYKSDVYAASNLPSNGWEETRRSTSSKGSGSSARSGKVWGDKAVLVLVGIRLGLEGVNPIYHESVKALFTFPQSVGIAGGRPSSSYYFVASQASSLFYLDPHLTRPAVPLEIPPASPTAPLNEGDVEEDDGRESPDTVNVPYTLDVVDVDDLSDSSTNSSPVSSRGARKASSQTPTTPPARSSHASDTSPTPIAPPLPRNGSDPFRAHPPLPVDPMTAWYADAYPDASLRTFHCDKVKKMPLSGLDPSMLLGFLCRDEADFEDFCTRAAKLPQKIFTIQDEPPTWDDDDEAGLESVSEPEFDDHMGEDEGEEGLVSGDTTAEAIEITKGQDGEDDEWDAKGTAETVERPFFGEGRGRLDSWVRPGNEGEAPNGRAIL